MGIDPSKLPDHFVSRLPPEERKKLGRAGMTQEEAQKIYVARTERELQGDVSDWLRANRIPYFSPRFDKRTTVQVGMPDYIACVERVIDGEKVGLFTAIECKCRVTRGKLTEEQMARMGQIIGASGVYLVIYAVEELVKALAHITGKAS